MHRIYLLYRILSFSILIAAVLSTIELYALPNADFTANKFSGCSPLLVTFSNTSTGNSPTYYWEFGNGNTSTLTNPAASFITAGTYQVKLTATDNTGSHSVVKTFTVFANPIANFTNNFSGGCEGDTICFTDLSIKGTGMINKWSWDFGDGNSSVVNNPCNIYTFSDTFSVSLVITDINGCMNTIIRNNLIQITPAQKVNFTASDSVTCRAPIAVNFYDGTTPAGVYQYLWQFGDGTTSTQKSPLKVFDKKGLYSVSLTVTNAAGCKRSLTKPNRIKVHDPKALFTSDLQTGCAPLKVTFFNKSTSADTNNLRFLWKTSANFASTIKNPVINFANTGKYSVTLIATIPGVCSDSLVLKDYIQVFEKPILGFNIDSGSFCNVPATIHIQSYIQNATSFYWTFGDGSTSTVLHPVKTYTKYGTYDIKLIASNTSGCKDSVLFKKAVKVSKSGFNFFASELQGCKPLKVDFIAYDTGMLKFSQWRWYINNLLIPNSSTLYTHNFTETGSYEVKCVGTNTYGCVDSHTYVIIVGDTSRGISVETEDTALCYNNATAYFKIKGLAEAGNPKYYIDYGDGNTGTGTSHQYKELGVYKISIKTTKDGCEVSSPMNGELEILGPIAEFSLIAGVCPKDTVRFQNKSHGKNNTYFWNLGNGVIKNQASFNYVYPKSGLYKVSLLVIDSATGCMDSFSMTIFRPEAPEPAFKLTNTTGCSPLTTSCIDTGKYAAGLITNWEWIFYDTLKTSGKNQSITLFKQGYFPVTLRLTDTLGCKYSLRKDSALHIYQASANFKINPFTGCIPLVAMAEGIPIAENTIVKHHWNWGNGDTTSSDTGMATYIYRNPPTIQSNGFPVIYTITDAAGCKFSSVKFIYPTKPIPEFTQTSFKKCGVDSILLMAKADPTLGFGPFNYQWYVDSIFHSIFPHVIKTFSNNETSTLVTFIKTDRYGCKDSVQKLIDLDTRKPRIGFFANPTRIDCPGPPVFFYDTTVLGAGNLVLNEWTFGDGSKSNLANPAKTYLNPGKYNLSYKIKDAVGCTDSIYKPGYIIIAGPVADYQYFPKTGCVPLAVNFIANSANAQRYEWDLGDGWVDTNAIHNHSYTRPNIRGGSYKPNLTVTDSAGCKRGIISPDSIMVYPLPEPNFIADKTIICIDNSTKFTNLTLHDIPMKQYRWSFGDGDFYTDEYPFDVQLSHTYHNEGFIQVSLTATDTLNCKDSLVKSALIEVLKDTIPPQTPALLRVTVNDNQHVQMDFNRNTETDFIYYTIAHQYIQGIPTAYKNKSSIIDTLFIEDGLNTLHQVYAYRISATDVCLNESPLSPLHATIELTATGVTNAIQLNWNNYIGWDSVERYEIYRLNDQQEYQKLDDVSGNQTTYTDTAITCFVTYFYKIKAIQSTPFNAQISWSDSSGAVPLFETVIPATHNIRATVVNDHHILLQWQKRNYKLPFTTLIYKSVDDGTPVFLKEILTTDTVLSDYEVKVDEHHYTYTTYLKDNCGGLSPVSNIARTILLKADLKENDRIKYDPFLQWTKYENWTTGVDYYAIQFRYDSLSTFQNIGMRNGTEELNWSHKYVSDQQFEYCYKIIGYQKDSNHIFSESNIVCLPTAPRLFAPNVFTINHDNLNEKFDLGGVFIDVFHLDIYNRYGAKVFTSDDINNSWDGTSNGKECAADVYVYIAEASGPSGQRIEVKGNVTLLR